MHPTSSSTTTTTHNQFLQKRTRDESIIYPAPETKRPKPDTSQSQPKSNLAPHQQYTQILNQAYAPFTYSSSRNPIPNPNSNSIYYISIPFNLL